MVSKYMKNIQHHSIIRESKLNHSEILENSHQNNKILKD